MLLQQHGKHNSDISPSHTLDPSMLFQYFHKWPHNVLDAPPNSLMDSTANPKVKTLEGKGVGARSLARNTLGVKGRAKAPRWGLGKLISNLIIHMEHKLNNKLVSAWFEHFGA
jgi:hypothetical protein